MNKTTKPKSEPTARLRWNTCLRTYQHVLEQQWTDSEWKPVPPAESPEWKDFDPEQVKL